MKKLVILLLLLAGVGGFGTYYLYSADRQTSHFRTVAVERGDLLAAIGATGTVEPEEVIDIGAQVLGQIVSFGSDPRDSSKPINFGSPVEQGTVLARIDDSVYSAQVAMARANLAQAQANVQAAEATLVQDQARFQQADRDWGRAQKMEPTGAIAQLDYDTSKSTFETSRAAIPKDQAAIAQAKAAVENAQAALRQAEVNLGYCTIKSPVKGIIVDRRVNIGQTVVSSLNAPSLFLIAKDLTRLQVWASVNEADVGNIHSGQPVTFTVDAYPGRVFKGVVAPDQPRLNASMNQNVITYTVVVNTDNSDGKLKPYLTANMQFEVSKHSNVLLVPNSALRWKPSPQQVVPEARDDYVSKLRRKQQAQGQNGDKPAPNPEKTPHDHGTVWVEDGGFVRPVKVQTGLTDGLNTEIVGGDLKEGMAAVVGESHGTAAGGTTNPFAPKLFGGKKG